MFQFLFTVRHILYATFPRVISTARAAHNENRDWKTLEDFGYYFNDHGELRDVSTNERFEFNVYKNRHDNQMRYVRLGEIVDEHVYKLLEDDGKLHRMSVPIDATDMEGKGFIFRSEDSFTCEKLALIIHGSGVVRAGQWARRLIINHSLESGTQLPYIKKARELGFGVLVLNSNQNIDKSNGKKIRGSGSPEEHFMYVWNEFVLKSAAKHIAIIAHSYGGVITTRAAAVIPSVIEKTFAVAFTDSVHYRVKSDGQEQLSNWMHSNVCNWASSSEDLDTPLRGNRDDCLTLSAGTTVHEETSWKAFGSVWSFIQKKWIHLQNGMKNQGAEYYNNTSTEENDDTPSERNDTPSERNDTPSETNDTPSEKSDAPMDDNNQNVELHPEL